jgi:hypothetical protein
MPLEGVPFQVGLIPDDATHIVISAGMEDVLPGGVWPSPMARVAAKGGESPPAAARRFGRAYLRIVRELTDLGLEVTLLGLPSASVIDPLGRLQDLGDWLDALNDEIRYVAFESGGRFLDVRSILSDPADFHGAEGPSQQGGIRLAENLARLITPWPWLQRNQEGDALWGPAAHTVWDGEERRGKKDDTNLAEAG